jgi:rhodanese-related sulfurtransferase
MKTKQLFFCVLLFLSIIGNAQTQSTVKSLTATEFKKTIETKSIVLIDVRSASEFADNHIPNAINIDVNNKEFESQVKAACKTKKVALYCRSGRRSKIAITKLSELKLEIFDLNNGINEWDQNGYPIIKK